MVELDVDVRPGTEMLVMCAVTRRIAEFVCQWRDEVEMCQYSYRGRVRMAYRRSCYAQRAGDTAFPGLHWGRLRELHDVGRPEASWKRIG